MPNQDKAHGLRQFEMNLRIQDIQRMEMAGAYGPSPHHILTYQVLWFGSFVFELSDCGELRPREA